MTDASTALVAELSADLSLFFGPLSRAARHPARLVQLCAALGWDLHGLVEAEVDLIRDAVSTADAALEDAVSSVSLGSVDEVVTSTRAALTQAFEDVKKMAADWLKAAVPDLPAERAAEIAASLAADVFDFLCREFLMHRWPLAERVLTLLGFITLRKAEPLTVSIAGKDVVLRHPVLRECSPVTDLPRLMRAPVASILDAKAAIAEALGSADAALSHLTGDVRGLQQAMTSAGCGAISVRVEPTKLTVLAPVPAPAAGQVDCGFTLAGVPLTLQLTAGQLVLDWSAAIPQALLDPRTLPGGLTLGPAPGDPPRVTLTCTASGDASLEAKMGGLIGLPVDLLTDGAGKQITATAHAKLSVNSKGEASVGFDSVTLRAQQLRLGGATGVLFDLTQATVSGLSFPFDTAALKLDLEGSCTLAGARVSAHAKLSQAGFDITASAEATLGGVKLSACAAPCTHAPGAPVLSLSVARGQAEADVSVRLEGDVLIPTQTGDTRLHLSGSASGALSAGRIALKKIAAAGSVTPLVLPAGIKLDTLSGAIDWTAPAQGQSAAVVTLALSGEAHPAGGSVKFAGSLGVSADLQSQKLDGVLTLGALPLPGGGQLISATVGLLAGGGAATLTVTDGSAGLFPRKADAAAPEDFHLAVKALKGSCHAGASLTGALSLSGKLVLPRDLITPLPDTPDKPAEVDLAIALSGTLQPLALNVDSFSAAPGNVSLQRASGLQLLDCHLDLAGLSLPQPAAAALRASLNGKLKLPGSVDVAFSGWFAQAAPGDLSFGLESTGTISLNGVQLLPQPKPATNPPGGPPGTWPTLTLAASTANGASLDVKARLVVPRKPAQGEPPDRKTGTIDMSGSLSLGRAADGALSLDKVEVSGTSTEKWPLAGPLVVTQLSASLKLDEQKSLTVKLAGDLLGENAAKAHLDATLKSEGANGLAVIGNLNADGIEAGGLRLLHADLGLEIHTQPASCTLTLAKGCIGALPNATGATTPEQFDLRFEDLAATLKLDGAGAAADVSGFLTLPASAFSSGDGKAAKVALQGIAASPGATPGPAQISLGFSPFRIQLKQASASLENVRLGGSSGVLVRSGRLTLSNFGWPPSSSPGWCASAAVSLHLPAGDVAASGELTAHSFSLRCRQALDLGGVQLLPLDPPPGTPAPAAGTDPLLNVLPTLELDISLTPGAGGHTQAAAHFKVCGQVSIPVKDGKKMVAVDGSLDATADDSGKLSITALHAMVHLEKEWELPGGLVLSDPTGALDLKDGAVGLSFSGGVKLPAGGMLGDGTGGSAFLKGSILRDKDGELTLSGEIADVHLAVLDQFRIFGGGLKCTVTTRPLEATLSVAGASAGLIRKPDGDALSATGYYFSVTGLTGSLDVRDGMKLELDAGQVSLPPMYAQEGQAAPALAIGDEPLLLTLGSDRKLAVKGSILAKDFTASAPTGDGARATLASGQLHFAASSLELGKPLDADALRVNVWFDKVSGDVHIPLPMGSDLDIGFENGSWDCHGLPTGKIGLKKDLAIHLGGDAPHDPEDDCFQLVFPGADAAGKMRNHLDIEPEGKYHRFTFDGDVKLQLPVKMLSRPAGSGPTAKVALEGKGQVGFTEDPGGQLSMAVTELGISGTDLCLGGESGLIIRQAAVRAIGLDALANNAVSATHPFILELTGMVEFAALGSGGAGPSLGLREARFEFHSFSMADLKTRQGLPKFTVKEMECGTGSMFKELPLNVKEALLGFKNQDLDVVPPKNAPSGDAPSFLFDPRNLKIEASVEVKVPLGQSSGGGAFMARTDRIGASIEKGLPKLTIGGIGFGVTGLQVPGMTLDGAVYLGDLDTPQPFFAGKVGGSVDGTGVSVLLAFQMKKGLLPSVEPMGLALDVNAGSVGIPLGPSGFLFTGASGGISWLACPIDPSDLHSYIDVPTSGAAKRNKPYPAKPADPKPGDKPSKDAMASSRPKHSDTAELKCPGECPPPSLGILFQPHPDTVLYPKRAILKFSALDEHMLELLGLKSWLQGMPSAPDPGKLARDVARTIRGGVEGLSPIRALPKEMQGSPKGLLDDLERNLRERLTRMLAESAAGTPWDIVKAAAWAGLPAVNETYQLTGTFSYAGISAFASVTGGFNLSYAGSVGVIGYLNFLGIRVGRLRGFFTMDNEQGMPDPTLCGDLKVSLGPLELGMVGFSYRLGYDVGSLLSGIVGALGLLAGPLLARLVREAIPIKDRAKFGLSRDGQGNLDVHATLPLLSQQQVISIVGRVLAEAKSQLQLPQIKAFASALVHAVWDSYQPECVFCGMVSPKIFGIPIGGQLVAARGSSDKTSVAAQFDFSPAYILGRFIPYIGDLLCGQDRASFGFSLRFPDPLDLVEECIDVFLQDKENLLQSAGPDLVGVALKGFTYLLDNAVFFASYDMSPLGLKLAGIAMRVILPSLKRHPSLHPGWVNPDTKPELPSRSEVLVAAAKQGKLAELTWKGTPADMAQLDFGDTKKKADGLSLIEDYFPHGGMIAGGYLQLPRIVVEGPPLDLIRTISDGGKNPIERASAALELVQKWLLQVVEVGQLTFYVPAPNPPSGDKAPKTPEALIQALSKLQIPEGFEPLTSVFASIGLAFFRGKFRGRVLGLDLGEGDIEAVPAAPGSGGISHLVAHFQAHSLGPLSQLLSVKQKLILKISQKPPEPIETYFNQVSGRLKKAIAESKAHHGQDVQTRLLGVVRETLASFESQIPRFLLEAEVEISLPPSLQGLITAGAGFHLIACSPGSGPASDDTPVGRIRHFGGAAVKGKLTFQAFGFSFSEKIEAALEPDPQGKLPPRLRGLWERASAAVDGAASGTALSGVRATFDSRPDPGAAAVTLAGILELPNFQLGPFSSGSLHAPAIKLGDPVRVTFDLSISPTGVFLGHASAEAQHQGFRLHAPSLTLSVKPTSPKTLAESLRDAVRHEFENLFRAQALGGAITAAVDAARKQAEADVKATMEEARKEAEKLKKEIEKMRDGAQGVVTDIETKFTKATDLHGKIDAARQAAEKTGEDIKKKLEEAQGLRDSIDSKFHEAENLLNKFPHR